MSAQISMRKTGLVVFLSRIASIFTGLIFLVLMTSDLRASDFGLWEVITDVLAFASYPVGLVTFWSTRDVARGRIEGRTTIATSLVLSTGGLGLFFLISAFSYQVVAAKSGPFILASILVPLSYWNAAANSVVTGHRPAAGGYSVMISEVAKIAVALPLVVVFKHQITWVILSMMVSYVTQAVAASYFVREMVRDSFSVDVAKRWFRNSSLPALIAIPYLLGVADTYVASIIAGGTLLTAFYQAAFAVASITGYSSYLGSALYPLLLKGGSDELPSATLDFSLLFAIPMAFGSATLAYPILFFLKNQYAASSTGLVILSFSALIALVSFLLDQTLLGREKADFDESSRLRNYLRSDLGFVLFSNLGYTVAYLVAISVTIRLGIDSGLDSPAVVTRWAAVQLVTTIVFMLIKLRRARQRTKIVLKSSFPRYVVSALVMSAVAFGLSSPVLNYRTGRIEFGVALLLVSVVAALVYFGLLFAIDRGFRALAGRLLEMITSKTRKGRADRLLNGRNK